MSRNCLQLALAAGIRCPLTIFLSFHFHVFTLAVPYAHHYDEHGNIASFLHIPPKPLYHNAYKELENT